MDNSRALAFAIMALWLVLIGVAAHVSFQIVTTIIADARPDNCANLSGPECWEAMQ